MLPQGLHRQRRKHPFSSQALLCLLELSHRFYLKLGAFNREKGGEHNYSIPAALESAVRKAR